jgi:hypothetical protein
LDSTGSGQGPVKGCCECGDEPSGSCATELVSQSQIIFQKSCLLSSPNMIGKLRLLALNCVFPSVRSNVTSREPLDGFLWHLIFTGFTEVYQAYFNFD